MSGIDPNDVPKLGLATLDADHAEEARQVDAALAEVDRFRKGRSSIPQVKALLDALYTFTRAHFEREEAAMLASGFPGLATHRADHERVLAEMDGEERRFLEQGDADRLRAYLAQRVPAWFDDHVRTLDRATATFTKSWGG